MLSTLLIALRRAAGVTIVCALFGCSTIKGSPPSVFNKESILKSTEISPESQVALLNSKTIEERNTRMLQALAAVDIRYRYFVEDLMFDRANVQSGFSLAVLAMSTAGASVASVAAKTNYALYSAAATGAQGVLDKNYFYEKTVSALISAMDAARAQTFLEIKPYMQLDITQYTGGSALADVLKYARAGSLEAALNQITKVSGASAQTDTKSAAQIYIPATAENVKIAKARENIIKENDLTKLNALLQKLNLQPKKNVADAVRDLTTYMGNLPFTDPTKDGMDNFIKQYQAANLPPLP